MTQRYDLFDLIKESYDLTQEMDLGIACKEPQFIKQINKIQ